MRQHLSGQTSGSIAGRALNTKSAYLEQYNLTIQKQVGANVFSVWGTSACWNADCHMAAIIAPTGMAAAAGRSPQPPLASA
jgi:hypothetical protein